jgi:alpha-tubulin suppressor-like RCC1 family protein
VAELKVMAIQQSSGRLRFGKVVITLALCLTLALPALAWMPPAQTPIDGSTRSGLALSWGYNLWGQLGDGTTTQRNSPVQVSGLPDVVNVGGGYYHSIGLKADGTVWAWGYNFDGQLGTGSSDTTSHVTATQVTSLNSVTAIAAGAFHNLALKSDGTVWAWGWNAKGQLGDGATSSQSLPVQVMGLDQVIAISGGFEHSLALKSDGTVWAWGYNFEGQLGDGTTTDHLTPTQVISLTDVSAIAAGWFHSLVLKSDGSMWAWGANWDGELGSGSLDGNVDSAHPIPQQVVGLDTGVIGLAAGPYHSLAWKADGTPWAWGRNLQGQLGDGTTSSVGVPQIVPGLANVASIAGGWGHSLALKSNGSVWAWGLNDAGQLGDGSGSVASGVPVLAVPQTVAGDWAWGQANLDRGWLHARSGNRPDSFYRPYPGVIPGLSSISVIAAGYYHSLAISVRPRWDVNGDHVVNILDLALVGMHWGEAGAPGWIQEDVNSDGVIGILDVAMLGVHWGETW